MKKNGLIDIWGYYKPSAYQHTVSFPISFTKDINSLIHKELTI